MGNEHWRNKAHSMVCQPLPGLRRGSPSSKCPQALRSLLAAAWLGCLLGLFTVHQQYYRYYAAMTTAGGGMAWMFPLLLLILIWIWILHSGWMSRSRPWGKRHGSAGTVLATRLKIPCHRRCVILLPLPLFPHLTTAAWTVCLTKSPMSRPFEGPTSGPMARNMTGGPDEQQGWSGERRGQCLLCVE